MELAKLSHHAHDTAPCADLPDLKRINYFHGQMLGVNDFRTEQTYFREKQKLHNRCLHGYGTVCGLMVAALPPPKVCKTEADHERENRIAVLEAQLVELNAKLEAAQQHHNDAAVKDLQTRLDAAGIEIEKLRRSAADALPPTHIQVECGLALDCEGNEIIVPRPHQFDPWQLLSETDRRRVSDSQGIDLYLSICYCEQPVDPMRPVMPNACGSTPECNPGKLRDSFKLRLSTERPPPDEACETCCGVCTDHCLPIAVLHGYRRGHAPSAIDNSVRRVVASYTSTRPATTITGISWTHGATYSLADGNEIIGYGPGKGIQVDFSRPVLRSTLKRGVIDFWVIEGGRTRSAGVYYLEGRYEELGSDDTVTSVRYSYTGDESLSHGDRLIVTIRCAFILDECCQPVDGAHVGGRVPLIEEYQRFDRAKPHSHCAVMPPGYGPWTSGAGTPGAVFESWFYLEQMKEGDKRPNKRENLT